MPTLGRHLPPSLPLLPLPSLIVHVDPSPINHASQIEATVTNDCTFDTAISDNAYGLGTLSSGTLGNLTSPVNVTSSFEAGSIALICTPGMTVSVALDYRVNGGSSNQRYLKRVSSNKTPAYQLYQDTAYPQVWDNGVLAQAIANFPASTQAYTVYARLFAVGSLSSIGNYRDIVTVTLSL